MKKRLILLLLLSTTIQATAQENKPRLLPSEAIALMYYRTDMNPEQSRDVNTKPIQPLVITEGLEGDELFYLGETYFWNLMPKESYAAFEKIKDQNSLAGRAAWQRMFIININGFQKIKETEVLLGEYRKKFKPISADRNGAFYAVASLAYIYTQEGEFDKAVKVISDEINSLTFEGPYSSYSALSRFKKAFLESDNEKEWRELTQNALNGLKAKLKQRINETPEKDIRYAEHSDPVSGMLTVMTEKLGYAQTNEKYQELIDELTEALNQ